MLTRDEEHVRALATGWRAADPEPRLRAILAYAEKLTRTPGAMEEADLRPLRDAGLGDRGILETAQVTAYYNFVNRMADGLGVRLEGPPSILDRSPD